MNVADIIGQKIQYLMDQNNISQRKMAEIIDVTHPTLKSYLSGENVISSVKLQVIAKYFGVSFDYFFTTETERLNLLFRADKPAEQLKEFDFQVINKRFQDYIDIVDLGKLKYLPMNYNLTVDEKSLSSDDEEHIEKVANETRRLFNISLTIPQNYFSILEENGINVIATPYENEYFFGASSYSMEHGSFIFVNTNDDIPEERQVFSLIHELGHLLFHRNEYKEPSSNPLYKNSRVNMNEKVANAFAGYFLLPRDLVKEYIETRKSVNMIDMKKHFKVSLQALYMALRKYGLITESKYKEFWKDINQNGGRKKEPSPLPHMDFEEKNSRLIDALKRLYAEDNISVSRISEILEIPLLNARKIVKKWGGLDGFYECF